MLNIIANFDEAPNTDIRPLTKLQNDVLSHEDEEEESLFFLIYA